MKKNLYYRSTYKRQNLIKSFLLSFFLTISSYPRLVLEVFIRRNMGERYFSMATATTIAAILIFFPSLADLLVMLILPKNYPYARGFYDGIFAPRHLAYLLFIIVFMIFSIIRWREVKRNPSVFDFGRFSQTSGNIAPFFLKYGSLNGKLNMRLIETVIEPLPFFLGGILLSFLGQSLGAVLIFCSLIYSLSYFGAYYQGDHFVMDIIDETIMNEEMESSFVNDKDPSETRGVRFHAEKPGLSENREKLLDRMIDDEDDIPEAS